MSTTITEENNKRINEIISELQGKNMNSPEAKALMTEWDNLRKQIKILARYPTGGSTRTHKRRKSKRHSMRKKRHTGRRRK